MNKVRLTYLDGLKGLCALSVSIFHFLLMFYVNGYIGWNCAPEAAAEPFTYYFKYFPYSILTNNSFPLYIFVGISSFVPAFFYFKHDKEFSLKTQAVKRYFRLMPMTLVGCLISVALFRLGWAPFNELGTLLGNSWVQVRETVCEYTVSEALKAGLLTAYIKGTNLVSSLWCVQYFFLGSLLTSSFLLLFGKSKKRYVIYAVAAVFLYFTPAYLSFLSCIIAADIITHRNENGKKLPYAIMLVLGVIAGLFPPVLLPSFIDITVVYAIGVFGVVTGIAALFDRNPILNSKLLCTIGEKSFALIIVHMLVLFSVNAFLYLYLNNLGVPTITNVLINFAVFIVVSFVASFGFDKCLTPLTNKLCKAAEAFFFGK